MNKLELNTEDYVSYETAKLLKEKGFDNDVICTDCWYDENGDLHRRGNYSYSGAPVYHKDTCCNAPTLQMAMKWLREVHNIAIETEWEHLWYAYIKPMTSKPSEEDYYQCKSSKYEEACEVGIMYCLENLI